MRKGPFQKNEHLVVGRKDVKTLNPNIYVDLAAEEVKLEIEESDIELMMGTEEAALFISYTMPPEEIEKEGLAKVVHRRRFKHGSRPALTCKAIVGGAGTRPEDESWIPPSRKPESRQKRRMAGCVLRSACRVVMKNHFYTYGRMAGWQVACPGPQTGSEGRQV